MKLDNQSGHRIRAARNMRDPKWTQDDLLAKMHTRHHMVFTRNTISRIETGQRYVTDLELIAFAGGAGLGLALCEEIARLHGARLSIDSTVGVGTRVSVFFPGGDIPPENGEGEVSGES